MTTLKGIFFDRYGKLLVSNQASYDIMVIPRELKNIDTLEFLQLLKSQSYITIAKG
jgi:penicillin-binding protein 2